MGRTLALLALFVIGAIAGMVSILHGIGAWKNARFSMAVYTAPEDVASNRYFVFVGFFALIICALCLFRLVRYDLTRKRKRK